MEAKFKFSLEKILELRKKETRKVMEEMAPYVSKLNEVTRARLMANNNISDFSQFEVKQTEAGDGVLMSLNVSYQVELRKLAGILDKDVKKRTSDLEGFQKRLMEAKKRERALEILKSSRKETWNKKMNKLGEREMEELVMKSQLINQ